MSNTNIDVSGEHCTGEHCSRPAGHSNSSPSSDFLLPCCHRNGRGYYNVKKKHLFWLGNSEVQPVLVVEYKPYLEAHSN